MQLNRLERVWNQVQPEILAKWKTVNPEELETCDGQFDLVIEVIRKTCHLGRSHLSLEGEIRDWLLERITHYEHE